MTDEALITLWASRKREARKFEDHARELSDEAFELSRILVSRGYIAAGSGNEWRRLRGRPRKPKTP